MRKFNVYKMDNFDYSGEVDLEYLEENYTKDKKFRLVYGDNGLCSLNRDLQRMCNRYKMLCGKGDTSAQKLAAQIRAKTEIVEELADCVL